MLVWENKLKKNKIYSTKYFHHKWFDLNLTNLMDNKYLIFYYPNSLYLVTNYKSIKDIFV